MPWLRISVLLLSAAGLGVFLAPMTVPIVNLGNAFGAAVCSLLLLSALAEPKLALMIQTLKAHPVGKVCLYLVQGLLLLGSLLCLTLSIFMYHAAQTPPESPQAVVILGCRVRGTVPSAMLQRRLDAACPYLQANPDILVVVSGGQGENEDISEAQCMYDYLTAHGIDGQRILLEDKSTSTEENLRFSKALLEPLGISRVAIATDGYHQLRAKLLAKQAGLQTDGAISAPTAGWLLPTYWVREWFGILYTLVS